jgi:hypothetical protein
MSYIIEAWAKKVDRMNSIAYLLFKRLIYSEISY